MVGLIHNMVAEAIAEAEKHAKNCSKLIRDSGLEEALEYCRGQDINPPQCSLTAQSDNAVRMRETAERMLSEVKWWKRRLESRAAQQFEFEQIKQGKVTNVISEESLEYYKRRKRR